MGIRDRYMYPVLDELRMVDDIGVTANKDAKAMAVVHTTALLETVVGFCGDLYGLWELAGLALLVVMLMIMMTMALISGPCQLLLQNPVH